MGLLTWLITGLLMGLLACRLWPGRRVRLLACLLLAAIGALVGGYISVWFGGGTLADLHPRTLLLALTGALLMLVVVYKLRL